MRRRTKAIAPLVALALVAAACGGDDDDSGSESTAEGTAESTAEATEETSEEATEEMSEEATEEMSEEATEEMSEDDGGEAAAGGEVATDFGVDAENKVIRVGLNADLSGPFASLVAEIVESQKVYWEAFNEAGGYQGWTVEPVVIDSGYATDVGIQNYEEMAQESEDGVLMITENTGSPITSAIAPTAADDNMLVIPLSWASLWPDPEFGATILEKQTTYCNEAINGVEWLKDRVEAEGGEAKLAIIGRPGEYGEDGSAGAKIAAAELGIEIVYDGTGAVAGDDRTAVISELVGSEATIVWVTLTPGELLDIFGNAVSQGFEATWSGSSPSFNYLVHMPSDFAEQFGQYYFQSYYQAPWATPGIPEMERLVAEMTARRPDLNISDVYTTGWIEGIMAETLIRTAIDQGDMTRANMVAISQSPDFSVDFGGLSANQSWPQDYDEALVRSSWIYDIDPSQFNLIPMSEYTPDNPGSTGVIPIEQDYVGTVAADYEFGGPCIEPSS
ncbi:ABC transporter substrate-binding protein [Ilumatobacter sp.]|uniref:ABC transporter substrate-binding protein n=1 Tax=Ilumatobacter sp. TaxID=1967498 RepID=UPI003AF71C39